MVIYCVNKRCLVLFILKKHEREVVSSPEFARYMGRFEIGQRTATTHVSLALWGSS